MQSLCQDARRLQILSNRRPWCRRRRMLWSILMVHFLIFSCSWVMILCLVLQALCSDPLRELPWIKHWKDKLDLSIQKLDRFPECFKLIDDDPQLECRLPRPGAISGTVLKHSCGVLDQTLAKHGPMVFKIGFTHCPVFRFRNPKYGYTQDRQKWQTMVVLYASNESVGPAFLEAALIEKYKCSSTLIIGFNRFHTLSFLWLASN